MSNLLRHVRQEFERSFSIPATVRRTIEDNPHWRIEFSEPKRVVALSEVTEWQMWSEESRGNTSMVCWEPDGYYASREIERPEFSHFISHHVTDDWECDISDVEGLRSSKSELHTSATLDDFAARYSAKYIIDISETNLRSNLSHREIRIINSPDQTTDHFVRHQWDGRTFLVNAGGSHHFATARYIAKRLGTAVPLKGKLHEYKVNPTAIAGLMRDYDLFIMNTEHIHSVFLDAMRNYGAPFCVFWLPFKYLDTKLVLLPIEHLKAKQVSTILRESGFMNFGNYLRRLGSAQVGLS